jgi:hypothetical protein
VVARPRALHARHRHPGRVSTGWGVTRTGEGLGHITWSMRGPTVRGVIPYAIVCHRHGAPWSALLPLGRSRSGSRYQGREGRKASDRAPARPRHRRPSLSVWPADEHCSLPEGGGFQRVRAAPHPAVDELATAVLGDHDGAGPDIDRAHRVVGREDLLPVLRPEHDAAVSAVRRAPGEAAFPSAWAAGPALTLDDVVAEALSLAVTSTTSTAPCEPPAGQSARG